jgi:hypothetical protein
MGLYLLSSDLRPFHGELDERVWIPLHLPFFFCSQSHRFSKMWIKPFACLVFVALLIPFLRFPSFAMASGSKEGESRVPFMSFGSFVLEPLYACTL